MSVKSKRSPMPLTLPPAGEDPSPRTGEGNAATFFRYKKTSCTNCTRRERIPTSKYYSREAAEGPEIH